MGKHLANEIQCQQMRCPLLYQTIIIITTSILTQEPTITNCFRTLVFRSNA